MKIIECVQGTESWFAAKRGKVSASRIADVVAKIKTGAAASRAKYAGELVAERLSGATAARYTNAAMQWGTETEPQARAMYDFMRDVTVVQVGLVLHPTLDMACASPDGLVGDDGLVEIKCPETHTHIETLLGAPVDGKYVKQAQWQLACTGRAWCDLASFDPRLPAEMQLHVTRIPRDPAMIAELESEVVVFLAEVDATVSELLAKYRSTMAVAA